MKASIIFLVVLLLLGCGEDTVFVEDGNADTGSDSIGDSGSDWDSSDDDTSDADTQGDTGPVGTDKEDTDTESDSQEDSDSGVDTGSEFDTGSDGTDTGSDTIIPVDTESEEPVDTEPLEQCPFDCLPDSSLPDGTCESLGLYYGDTMMRGTRNDYECYGVAVAHTCCEWQEAPIDTETEDTETEDTDTVDTDTQPEECPWGCTTGLPSTCLGLGWLIYDEYDCPVDMFCCGPVQ